MEIMRKEHQNPKGLNKDATKLLNILRLLVQIICPLKKEIYSFHMDEMLHSKKKGDHYNYLLIHHKMFNKSFSIKIYLKFKAYRFIGSLYEYKCYCQLPEKSKYTIVFRIKDGVGQKYKRQDNFLAIDLFLLKNQLYQKLNDSIERILFKYI